MKKSFRKAIALVLTVGLIISPLQDLNLHSIVNAAETTTLTDSDLATAYSETSVNHVSVHDPSVVYDGNGTYYIFGSHMAWAKSTDLINWTTFTNNINTDYRTLFANNITWAAMGDSVYDASGNMWAPDVIYNTSIGKWCMYMSINGCSWNSSIAMLTADSLDGNWTYAGTVVYSGFTDSSNNHNFTYTDYDEVTGDTTLPARYIQSAYTNKDGTTTTLATTWNKSTGAHAIDPSVFYGQDGKLYMSYGSWSGGIYILQLSGTTGLRDTSVTYSYVANTSDPYMGIKLAGGYQTSGEASYIEYIDGYYYLFVTNGGLTATGGYNMRVYRSTNPTGPYTDVSGQSPKYTTGTTNTNSDVGTRLMSYYKWNYQQYAQVAQGHNSAIVDPVTGKSFLVYHTRTNDGTEGHSVRVHQLFTTENHYLVAAPFEYSGETINATGYALSDVAGTYEVILQKQSVDYANLEYCSGQAMTLNEDGTITGAYTGTWTMVNGKPYCNLVIGGVNYEGVFVEQTIEGTNIKTMSFTVVGSNDVCMWGAKYPSAKIAIAMTEDHISVVSEAYSDITLSTTGLFGANVSWSSSDPSIIANDGKVTAPSTDTSVTLTATISRDSYTYQKNYTVLVHKAITNYNDMQLLSSAFVNNPQDLSTRLDGSLSIANPYLNNTSIDTARGIKVKFDVQSTGTNKVLATILSFLGSNGTNGRLYFTPGSYLGYSGTGGYFDANMYSYGLVTDYIGTTKSTIELSFTSSGFEVDVNGIKAYDQSILSTDATGRGNVTDYYNIMYWLTHTADTVKFGTGSFWTATGYDEALCTISNVYFYGYITDPNVTKTHTYSENYNSATTVGSYWTSANLQTGLAFAYKDPQKQYAQFTVTGTSGTRGAVSLFPSAGQVTGKYTVETDVNLYNANATGIENQFVITNSARAYTSSNVNYGVATGYIVKLSTTAGLTTWSINGGQASVVIPKSTWINIKAFVDTTAGTAVLKITNKETGAILYSGTVTTSGTGTLQGLYLMGGRTSSILKVDNIIVDQYVTGASTSATDLSTCTATLGTSSVTYNGAAKKPYVIVTDGSTTLTQGDDYLVSYSNNTDVGTATVTITGIVDYTGTITKTFTINPRNLTYVTAALSASSYTYTGTAMIPTVTVKDGAISIPASNYTVAYTDNTDAGTATATLTFSGNYTGTITKSYAIIPKDTSSWNIALSTSSYTYDGTAKTPFITVTDGSTTLTEGTDYVVTYSDNTDAGTATVTITGQGNYTGTRNQTFAINAADISTIPVTVSDSAFTYDGTAKTTTVTLVNGETTLLEGTDYDVAYANNIDVGTATLTLTGKGNYTGSVEKTFDINPIDASVLNATLNTTTYTYDGTEKTPSATVEYGEITLTEGTDYTVTYVDNTSIGTATVSITLKGVYSGTITKTFTINPISLSTYSVAVDGTSIVYDGTTKTPAITVSDGDTTLVEGTDYEVSYSDNINAGTATVTVTGKGNYAGEITGSFTIATALVSGLTMTLEATSFTYDGTAKTPSVIVKDGTNTLTEGTDYSVSYASNTIAGTAFVIVTGAGNYSGTVTQAFIITTKEAAPFTVSLEATSYIYDGTAKTPAVTVQDGSTTLLEGTDYTLSYINNTNVGTATVCITGIGNYSGIVAQSFAITAKEVSALTVSLGTTSYLYDRNAKTPTVTVNDGTTTLTKGFDYTVSYSDNINVGTATVSIIGIGNYTGTTTQTFTITAKEASSLTVSLGTTSYLYDGTAKVPTVTVYDSTATLTEGTDYTVAYENNINVGTAIVSITGIGNYTGAETQSFIISAKEASVFTVSLGTSSYTYDGTAKTPAVTVQDGTSTLTEGTDYTVSYADNSNVGTATVTITGIGNYSGTATAIFTIVDRFYTVTFVDYNDTVLNTQTVKSGTAATAPTSPSRQGYSFSGWDKSFDSVTSDMTVKAKYTVDTITNGEIAIEGIDGTTLDSSYELVVERIIADISTTDKEVYNTQINTLATGKELVDVFDIKLMSNDVAVQPDGNLKIKIKLTAEQLAYSNLDIIYINNAGTITILPSTIEDGYITFVTNHFSNYGIIGTAATTTTETTTTETATTDAATTEAATNASTVVTTSVATTTESTDTSDHTQVFPLYVMLIASAAGIVIVTKRKRQGFIK